MVGPWGARCSLGLLMDLAMGLPWGGRRGCLSQEQLNEWVCEKEEGAELTGLGTEVSLFGSHRHPGK